MPKSTNKIPFAPRERSYSLQGNFFYPQKGRHGQSFLKLADGSVWEGTPVGAPIVAAGEAVFTTGMVGYVESLTDPSYAGQILVFTFPLIGNYGVPPPARWESKRIHARGAIFAHLTDSWSHWEGVRSLRAWLKKEHIPALDGVDTRALTQRIRQYGCTPGVIAYQGHVPEFHDPNQDHLVAQVSPKKITELGKGKKKIIFVDCGAKEHIVRSLVARKVRVMRVPFDYDYSRVRADGIVISNGPGDPAQCKETIAILKKVLARKKPIFGICLGSQLMGLAAGARTYKLPYGHRGQNQPCLIEGTDRCVLTSQNHGFAVRAQTLPRGWRVTFRNANDQSVEGIRHTKLPYFSVQFHPEAHPGPHDTNYLFDEFVKLL